jgi:cytochrome c oxidase subunit IV
MGWSDSGQAPETNIERPAIPAPHYTRMNDRNLVRGLFLMAISLLFGLEALRYPLGEFSRAGPGLFPLMVASMLLLIGLITAVRSRFVEHVHLAFNFRNIAVILGALCGFALVSHFVNMILGIITMVFIASFAGKSKYSVMRNLYISAGLVAVALAFQKLLGFNLPLY